MLWDMIWWTSSSADSGQVTWYRAELTGADICPALFKPIIFHVWTETCNNTALAAGATQFVAILLNCRLKASGDGTSRNCTVTDRCISQPTSELVRIRNICSTLRQVMKAKIENAYSNDKLRWKSPRLEISTATRRVLRSTGIAPLSRSLKASVGTILLINHDRFIPNHFQLIVRLSPDS